MDILFTIIIFAALIFVGFILWCALKVASDFDDISEKQWREFLEKEKEKNERAKENEI